MGDRGGKCYSNGNTRGGNVATVPHNIAEYGPSFTL